MNRETNFQFYCLSYNNNKRHNQMKNRFENLEIDCIFYKGVDYEDPRIKNYEISHETKRVWSCMYGHLDMINNFYNNINKEFGIFCEDDIYINKNLKVLLKKILFDFKILNLDVLLLGYLVPFKIGNDDPNFSPKHSITTSSTYKYHNFPHDVWGTQMYVLSKKQAKYLLDKYYLDYASKTIKNVKITPF